MYLLLFQVNFRFPSRKLRSFQFNPFASLGLVGLVSSLPFLSTGSHWFKKVSNVSMRLLQVKDTGWSFFPSSEWLRVNGSLLNIYSWVGRYHITKVRGWNKNAGECREGVPWPGLSRDYKPNLEGESGDV